MVIVRENLARLLRSSKERVRVSELVRERSREIILRSRQAVSISHAAIGQSDQTIDHLKGKRLPQAAGTESPAPPAGPSDLMQVLSGLTLANQTIEMDGKHFIGCSVLNCTLEYNGQPLVVESTRFDQCSFRFKGEAALTLKFLECFGLAPEAQVECVVPSTQAGHSQRPN